MAKSTKALAVLTFLIFALPAESQEREEEDRTLIIPEGSLVARPRTPDKPILIKQIRFAIVRDAMNQCVLCMRAEERTNRALTQCIEAQSPKRDNGWRWLAVGAVAVGGFILGAAAL